MPYIKSKLDRRILNAIAEAEAENLAPDGRLNYFLFKLMLVRREMEGESYQFYKNYRAELLEAAAEIKRRHMDIYEDKKKELNGDVE